jgi:hypothetical protein
MPLFTLYDEVNEKDLLSRAIHAAKHCCWISKDDLFKFPFVGPSDLVDLYYPDLPKRRNDQMLMTEVLVSSGTGTNRKKILLPPSSRSLAKQASIQTT